MQSESDPITDDEWLLRIVWRPRFTEGIPPISPKTFEPRVSGHHPDEDGISLFREACLQAPTDVLEVVQEAKRGENGIVRISVALIKSKGLSVQASPIETIPGHVVIPELNSLDFKANKSKYNAARFALAEEASQHIVKRPDDTTK